MRRAFTLLELLVVIAIMAILGSITVAGYRQMKRGMEERGTMQNINQFIRTAYQRAQIDRQPVAVYYWNETLQGATSDSFEIVVGKAIAVRRAGRITRVRSGELYDEFGDLKYNTKMLDEDEEGLTNSDSSDGAGINFYQLNGDEGNDPKKSVVYEITRREEIEEALLSGGTKKFECYAYELKDPGGVTWSVGDAYGFEFAEITLPHGYIFGNTYSKDIQNATAGHGVIRFQVSANSGDGGMSGESGASTVVISSLRPGNTGSLSAEKVGTTDSPTKSLE